MARRVRTQSGPGFNTLAEAKAHYGTLRDATEIGAKLCEPERSNVLDFYRRYCDATNYWPDFGAVDVIADWDNRKRPTNSHARTKAFYVVGSSGQKQAFSLDKALSAISR